MGRPKTSILIILVVLLLLSQNVAAFGAGNIASVSKIEGKNWRHGDIEDMLKYVPCLSGMRWKSVNIKRVYFGNWLRDYSQAVDIGTLKGVQADAIRLLVWILGFMSFGYATAEFEVTADRLGVYRPEEHIDNPEGYGEGADARQYDSRLRGPVAPEELEIDPITGMKNYIANERGSWATSAGYLRFSFARSIHFGRLFTNGAGNTSGRETDLFEAMRCLGQGLHCLEDFGAHSNYIELALLEHGHTSVFPYVGSATRIELNGHQVFPLVTGTFGGVDFLHSVIGEASDHVTQSEVDEMNRALQDAAGMDSRGFTQHKSKISASDIVGFLGNIPGTGEFCREANELQRGAMEQEAINQAHVQAEPQQNQPPPAYVDPSEVPHTDQHPPSYSDPNITISMAQSNPQPQPTFSPPPTTTTAQPNLQPQPAFSGPPTASPPAGSQQPSNPSDPLSNFDLQATMKKVYPILEFRDRVMKRISEMVERVPGLEMLLDTASEKITLFAMGLLAPYVIPVINAATKQLKFGSSTVVGASAKQQHAVFDIPTSTAPTHSLLSKDHFSNVLNEPAGQIASAILQYAAPRVIYAWENPGIPVEQVLDDIIRVLHHPGNRDPNCQIHQTMFNIVDNWTRIAQSRGVHPDHVLSAESVKRGANHTTTSSFTQNTTPHSGLSSFSSSGIFGFGSHSKVTGSVFNMLTGKNRGLDQEDLEPDDAAESFDYGSLAPDTQNHPHMYHAQAQDSNPYGYLEGNSSTYHQGQNVPMSDEAQQSYQQGYQQDYPHKSYGYNTQNPDHRPHHTSQQGWYGGNGYQ